MIANRKTIEEAFFEIHFPVETGGVLDGLLEKYNLKERVKDIIEKTKGIKTPEEREEIIENLPGRVIVNTSKKVIRGEIDLKDLPSELARLLKITPVQAKKLADEIAKKLIVLAEIIPVEEKEEVPPPSKPRKPFLEEKLKPKKPDIYREPIE